MRFFFYGTLLADADNAVAAALHRKLDAGIPAVAQGQLYAIPDAAGWYPALVAGAGGGAVRGMLYRAGAWMTAADLAALDAYEQYRPDDPDGSEYLRADITVATAAGCEMAQAYLFRAQLPDGARAIAGGDFRAFLAETGLPAYREK